MGGSNSGRWGGRPTAEACASFGLSMRGMRPKEGSTIGFRRTFTCDGEAFPVVVIFDWAEGGHPSARLRHSIRTGDGAEVEYRVALARSPCRFGGERWWWRCPDSGARAFKLFLPRGGRRFWSREAYGLGYACQRGTALDRAHRANEKAERRLWWHDDGAPCPPPGMRRRTFERLVARWETAKERLEMEWEPRTLRVLARLMARGS